MTEPERAEGSATLPSRRQLPRLLVIGAWLAPYLDEFRARLTVPVEIELLASETDAGALDAIAAADVVITSTFGAAAATAARRLRFLQVPGSGTDRIAIAALEERVVVANCHEHERGIAEYVIMQCLALHASLIALDRGLRAGDWSLSISGGAPPRPELGGRTIGVLGFGRIGREVARLARAFEMRVVVMTHRPPTREEWTALGVDSVSGPDGLLEVLSGSDFVAVCLPLDDSTRGLVGRAELRAMRPSAFIVNPSRGPIVDEEALYEALQDGAIAGAAIDTWYRYPDAVGQRVTPSSWPFESLHNVILTPHIAGYTSDTMRRRVEIMAANVSSFLSGGPVRHLVSRIRVGDGHA